MRSIRRARAGADESVAILQQPRCGDGQSTRPARTPDPTGPARAHLMGSRTSAVVTARARASRGTGTFCYSWNGPGSQPTVIVESRGAGSTPGGSTRQAAHALTSGGPELLFGAPGSRRPRTPADPRADHPAGAAWAARASSPRSGGCKRAPRNRPAPAGFMPTTKPAGCWRVVATWLLPEPTLHLQCRRAHRVAAC